MSVDIQQPEFYCVIFLYNLLTFGKIYNLFPLHGILSQFYQSISDLFHQNPSAVAKSKRENNS